MNHTRRAGAVALAVAVPLAAMVGMMANAEGAGKLSLKFGAKPPATTESTEATFTLKRNVKKGIKAQQFRVDGGSWQKTAGRFTLKGLGEGKHTVQVKLVLKNGRAATANYSWIVDSVAPEAPPVHGGDAHWSNADSRMVTRFAAEDAAPSSGLASYERRISNDGGRTWGETAPGDSILVSREGDTRVQYRAVDAAGNASAWAEAIVRLDRTDPSTPTVSGGSTEWQSAASVEIVNAKDAADPLSGVPADGYQMQIRKDGDPFWMHAELDDSSLAVRREGTTAVRFRAVDRAGNTSAWSPIETVKLDRTAPTVPAVPVDTEWSNAASETLSATSTDTLGAMTAAGIDHYLVKTSTDAQSYSEPTASDGTVAVTHEGYTYVSAAACDVAGNCSEFSAVKGPAAMLDRTAPGVPWIYYGSSTECTTHYASAYVDLYGGDNLSGVAGMIYKGTSDLGPTIAGEKWQQIGGGSISLYLTSAEITGKVQMQFAFVDAAGNQGAFTDVGIAGSVLCLG